MRIRIKFLIFIILVLILSFFQCKKPKKESEAKEIIALTINFEDISLEAKINSNNISFDGEVPFDSTQVTIDKIELSDNAISDKNVGDKLNVGVPNTITVVAENNTLQVYNIFIKEGGGEQPESGDKPMVSTDGITNITISGAELSGTLLYAGDIAIKSYGYVWGGANNPTITGNGFFNKKLGSMNVNAKSVSSEFYTSIDGLEHNTTYYIRAYATNSYGTGYGEVLSFTTLELQIPKFGSVTDGGLQTSVETSISGSSIKAIANSKIETYGDGDIIQHGHVYSSISENDDLILNGNGVIRTELGKLISPEQFFNSSIIDLNAFTVYYIRPYVVDDLAGVIYGRQLTFITPAGAPTTTIGSIKPSLNGATISGAITNLGGNGISNISYGHVWSTTSGNLTTSLSTKTYNESIGKSLSFESDITNLSKNTKYYAKTYANNGGTYGYSNVKSFKTLNDETDILSITMNVSISGNTIYSQTKTINDIVSGNSLVFTELPYHTNKATINNLILSDQATSTINSVTNLTVGSNLSIGTNNIVVKASNGNTSEYVIVLVYKPIQIPEITTLNTSNVSFTSATLNGNITSMGAASLIKSGFVCSKTESGENLVIGTSGVNSFSKDGGYIGGFNYNITELSSNSTYYVRAYAINEAGISYGNMTSFSTMDYTLPEITTLSASNVSYTTVILNGKINNTGNTSITQHGFVYSNNISGDNLIIGNDESIIASNLGGGQGNFNRNLHGLSSNTTYYAKAYATNTAGTVYGNEIMLSTKEYSLPSVVTLSANNILFTTAKLNGNITDLGASSIIQHGFIYSSTNSGSELVFGKNGVNILPNTNAGSIGNYSNNISGLSSNNTYYVKAYVINFIGTNYGNEISLTTPDYTLPEITTLSANNVSYTSATLNGTINDTGNTSVLQHGFIYSRLVSGEGLLIGNSNVSNISDINGNHGDFSKNINGLTSNAIYYARAYAKNTAGTKYGEIISFTTNELHLPEIITLSANSILFTTATLNGKIIDLGADSLIQHGFLFSNNVSGDELIIGNSNVTTIPNTGGDLGTFTQNISELSSNSTYYVKAYAINVIGTSYGNEIKFSTVNYILPEVTTLSANNILFTSATLNGTINSIGNTSLTQHGFVYSNSVSGEELTIGNSMVTAIFNSGGSQGSFNQSINDLSSNSIYFVRAYAINSAGTKYGDEISFLTKKQSLPDIITLSATNILYTSASLNGNIIDLGSDTLIQHGVIYSSSFSGDELIIGNNGVITIPDSEGNLGTFAENVNELSSNTTYFYKAYAINVIGTKYGNEIAFSTDSYDLPGLNTLSANNISYNSATLNGSLTKAQNNPIINNSDTNFFGVANQNSTTIDDDNFDYSLLSEAGFIYSSTMSGEDLAIGNEGVIDVSTNKDTSVLTKNITGLSSNTTYYVRTYAMSEYTGTSHGNEISFSTKAISYHLPEVTTLTSNHISFTTATLNGKITDLGYPLISQHGFVYSRVTSGSNLTIGSSEVTTVINLGGNIGAFYHNISGLSSNSTYYVRAYVKNNVGTNYGELTSFSTDNYVLPGINTLTGSNISFTTAKLNGEITSIGNPAISQYGFIYSTNISGEGLVVNNNNVFITLNSGGNIGPINYNLTGLSSNTTYYVRAYASNTYGVNYGNQISLTTKEYTLPEVTTLTGSNILFNSTTLNGEIINAGNSSLSQQGFIYSKNSSDALTLLNNGVTVTEGNYTSASSFIYNLFGISGNVTYYYVAYATNKGGTAYGEKVSFTTNAIPSEVNTLDTHSISTSSATLSGQMIQLGNPIANERGFVYSYSVSGENLILGNTDVTATKISGMDLNQFSTNLTGLNSNKTYYVRAFATNEAGTVYGIERNFKTIATELPDLLFSISGNTLNGTITSIGSSNVTDFGFVWSLSGTPTISNNTGSVDFSQIVSTVNHNFTQTLTNGIFNIRAYATNSEGTSYSDNTESFIAYIYIPDDIFRANIEDEIGSSYTRGKSIRQDALENQTILIADRIGSERPQDFTGLEYMRSLNKFYTESNSLTTLDISNNTNLTLLNAVHNSLTQINISNNTSLTRLDMEFNSLTSIDISRNTLLNDIQLNRNSLSNIDLSSNTSLTSLEIRDNNFQTMDISNNTSLKILKLGSQNILSSIDLENNTSLTHLSLYTNALTNIDLSKNTNLKYLDVSDNSTLTNLDVSNNPSLTSINTSINPSLTCIQIANGHTFSYSNTDDHQFFSTHCNIIPTKVPDVTTTSAWNISGTGIVLKGNVDNLNAPQVSSYGFIYGTTSGNNLILSGSGVTTISYGKKYSSGSFEDTITGLNDSNTYYVKAFAINSIGIGYGEELSFIPNQSNALIEIKTPAELQGIATGGLFGNYIQTKDIDLSGIANFAPIGSNLTNMFQGSFNGGGYVIRNLTIDDETATDKGLFGYIFNTAIIENVSLEDVNIKSSGNTGGLVGNNLNATIRNSYVMGGYINSMGTNFGGLVGVNKGLIENSYASVNIVYASSTGGLVGENSFTGRINNSYSISTLKGGNIVGGLLGSGNTNNVISQSYSAGSTNNTGTSIGGATGSNSDGNANDLYWNSETSGQNSSDSGTSRTSTTMIGGSSNFSNFGSEWTFNSSSYPVLTKNISSVDKQYVHQAAALIQLSKPNSSDFLDDTILYNEITIQASDIPSTGEAFFTLDVNGAATNDSARVDFWDCNAGSGDTLLTTSSINGTTVTLKLNAATTDKTAWTKASGTNCNISRSNIGNVNSTDKLVLDAVVTKGSESYTKTFEITFGTLTPPIIETSNITSIQSTSATFNGNITSVGNSSVTYGFIYSSIASGNSLTLENNQVTKITNSDGSVGTFSNNLTGLNDYTKYYVKAYAKNFSATVYGTEKSFTTLSDVLPIVVFSTSGNTLNGTITSIGGSNVTSFGFVWSISGAGTPTITNNSGSIDFTQQITTAPHNFTHTLTNGILEIRAYATNSYGTIYSSNLENFIAYINIPDDVFRYGIEEELGNSYTRGNSIRQDALQSLTFLYVDPLGGVKPQNLIGLEYMSSLKNLLLSNLGLTTIDLSANTNLEFLDFPLNSLTNIDISKNTSLKHLSLTKNSLTSIDVSTNTSLKFLELNNNSVTYIDVSNNTSLTTLVLQENELQNVDLTNNTKLSNIWIFYNSLTNIDLGNKPNLEVLLLDENSLTSIDLSNAPKISRLTVGFNSLTHIDLGDSSSYLRISLRDNSLTSINLSNASSMNRLVLDGNSLTSIDISNSPSLNFLSLSGNNLTSLDISNNININYISIYNNPLLTCTQILSGQTIQYIFAESGQSFNVDCTP